MVRLRIKLLVGLVLVIAACGEADADGPQAGAEDSGLLVVATTNILGDVVGEIVGDAGRVEVIVGPGVDPHDFQPSAADAELLRTADLVVANGLGLEGDLVDVIEAAEGDGANVVEIADQLDPIPFAEDAHEEEEEDEHGDEDPHVWQDPVRMIDGLGLIAAALTELDTDHPAGGWQERADAYAAEIQAVHETNETVLAAVPEERRKLVTNHEAFGYFADRYGFEIVGTVIPGGSTLAEPSAADLADLVHEIEEEGVPAIFVENTDPGRLAEVLSAELGGEIGVFELFSDSLGEPGSGADTYLGLIESNARIVAEALG